MGIENEFGVVFTRDGRLSALRDNEGTLLTALIKPDIIAGSFGELRLWLPNGSLFYVDNQDTPEFATCECRRVRDVVLHNKAGERIAARILKGPTEDGRRPLLFKNNVGYMTEEDQLPVDGIVRPHFPGDDIGLRSMGCHDNYLIFGLAPDDEYLYQNLAPFLITRQIFDGAGWWADEVEGVPWMKQGSFFYSQRALFVEVETARFSNSQKPILCTKDTHYVGDDLAKTMRRLQLTVGDANILEAAIFLKLGTTSLVLALIEENLLSLPKCVNAVPAIRAVALDEGAKTPLIIFEDGTSLSALDTQALYFEKVRQYVHHTTFESEESEQEAKEIVVLWEQALNAIEHNDTEWMLGRLDWATKRFIGEEAVKQKGATGQAAHRIRKTVDILYHAISDPRMQQRLNARWPSRRLLSDEEIEQAIITPPRDTRANLRGKVVQMLAKRKFAVNVFIQWFSIGYATHNLVMYDPLEAEGIGVGEIEEFVEVLARMEPKPISVSDWGCG